MSELALKLIREAKQTKAKKLDLGSCGLTELPEELFELVWLEELHLSSFCLRYTVDKNKVDLLVSGNINDDKKSYNYNSISQIPDKVNQLKNLKFFSVNDFVADQESDLINLTPLSNLLELQELYIPNTKVKDLSPLIGLNNLTILSIYNTEVDDLKSLESLHKLIYIEASFTKINDISFISKLRNLQHFAFSYTPIHRLPFLKNLKKLRNLYFDNTQIQDLSPIKNLIVEGVQVKVSDIITREGIYAENCPLTNPPIEIAKQGNKAILNYWKQIEEQGTKTINEAKLIIVGEGDTGKTTLFNKLIDPTFDLNATPTKETQGINIHEGLEIRKGFRANLWDFGGQELQYMTHQFFLTPNAVYVLMMEARAEAPNLAYWFKIISLLGKDKTGGKVSLVIVLNKKAGSTGMPQYQDLLKVYADDFDYQFIEVDLAVNDKRWESLRESIEERLVNLPIVKNKLPKQWNPIREALRERAQQKPYFDAASLHDLCDPFEVRVEADQFLMTNYLHQLGSLLHFQSEEDELLDLIVLSPEWVVEGVYTVLKNQRIREELKGKFTKTDMKNILCNSHYQIGDKERKYTRVDAEKLLQLMSKNNFDICYKSQRGNKYVAAQLLPDDRPSNFRWNPAFTVTLQFRYQYPIMPKGLMSRLIVRLSDYIETIDKQEMVWKKGAILSMKIDGSTCRVLMREEAGETRTGLRQIVIEVLEDNAPYRNRKYALQRVRQEIESLHRRWFRNITSEQIIPCNCEECKHSDSPHFYELTKLMKVKRGSAFCYNQENLVSLQQLLEGVYEPSEIKNFAQEQRI